MQRQFTVELRDWKANGMPPPDVDQIQKRFLPEILPP
jgi:hypothetical protein